MLVLQRKEGETIQIGQAEVHIVQIRGGRVRIAIDAPQEMKILRGELRVPPKLSADLREFEPENAFPAAALSEVCETLGRHRRTAK